MAILLFLAGNRHKWVPLQIDMKSEVPRDNTASRNNRQNEQLRQPSNNRNESKGMCGMHF